MMDVKIVIWDLDDTFWKGTLSEGNVRPVSKNIELVKELTDRGIMNSIVSKNDERKAMAVLKEWGGGKSVFYFSADFLECKG